MKTRKTLALIALLAIPLSPALADNDEHDGANARRHHVQRNEDYEDKRHHHEDGEYRGHGFGRHHEAASDNSERQTEHQYRRHWWNYNWSEQD